MKYELIGPSKPAAAVGVVIAELQRIDQRDGGIAPEALFTESRPTDAPLHHEFEWDGEKAIEQLGVIRARQIIRSVHLVPQPELNETTQTIRAFISIHNPAGDHPQARLYKPTLDVLRDPGEADEVKRRFAREVIALRQRYMALLELDSALNQALQQVVEAAA